MRACVPTWSMCQRAGVPAWLRAKVLACQRGICANVPKACQLPLFYANVPINMPAYHKACQFFKHSSYEIVKGNFYTLLHIKNFYIIIDIIVIHIKCICLLDKNCIILHFFTSCHS